MPFHWPRAHHVTANYGLFKCLAANNILLMHKWIHAFLSTVPLAWKFAISEFPRPLYQNEVKCSAFDMEMICYCHANSEEKLCNWPHFKSEGLWYYCRPLRFPKIFIKRQTRWSNDKKIKHKISWFVSGEQITYLRQPSVSANDWSLTNHHILLNLVQ